MLFRCRGGLGTGKFSVHLSVIKLNAKGLLPDMRSCAGFRSPSECGVICQEGQ